MKPSKPHDKQFRKKTLGKLPKSFPNLDNCLIERRIPKKLVYALERINDDIDKTWQSEFIVYSEMVSAYRIIFEFISISNFNLRTCIPN